KRGDRVKCLFWDRGGFALYYKRLSRGKFKMPRVTPDADRVILDVTELAMLLGGFELASARRVAAWQPKSHQASAAKTEQSAFDHLAARSRKTIDIAVEL